MRIESATSERARLCTEINIFSDERLSHPRATFLFSLSVPRAMSRSRWQQPDDKGEQEKDGGAFSSRIQFVYTFTVRNFCLRAGTRNYLASVFPADVCVTRAQHPRGDRAALVQAGTLRVRDERHFHLAQLIGQRALAS